MIQDQKICLVKNNIPLVIAAAGLGSRLFPITWAIPKELLPINNKPVLHYLLLEALQAGIKKIICITSKRKESLISYLTYSHNQEEVFLQNNEQSRLNELHELNKRFEYEFLMQEKPNGVGDAILKAEEGVKDDFFCIAYPDDVLIDKNSGFPHMMNIHKKYLSSIILVEKVDPEKVHLYGIIRYTKEIEPGVFSITQVIEKPEQKDAPSCYAIIGRYIMHRDLFSHMKMQEEKSPCNIAAFNSLIKEGYSILAVCLNGRRFDIGTIPSWLEAVREMNVSQ